MLETGQREIELRGGRIILHTRANDRHGIWQCRFRLGADRKLVRRSTRTSDLAEAKATAEELYEELRFRHREKIPFEKRTFKAVAEEYLKRAERDTEERKISAGRVYLIRGTLKRYLIPYFGHHRIDKIGQSDFSEYDEWRLNYWRTGDGAERIANNAALIPAPKTLVMEQSILRQVFRHAVERGDIEQIPYIRPKRAKTNRRGAFDVGEYRILMRTIRKLTQSTNHPRIKRDRERLALYVQFMIGTGLRVGEARNLKWNDVEIIGIGDGKKTALRLWVDGKTGKRAVIGTRGAKRAIRALLAQQGYKSLTEAQSFKRRIFTHDDGSTKRSFEVGFKSLLKRTGLENDRYGRPRTVYSLRHSYATFRLLYGDADIYILAKNMGTSVAMIEQHYGHVSTTLAADRLTK